MKIAVLSNVNMNILIKNLSKDNDVYETEGYGNYIEEMINPNSGLNNYKPNIIFIIIDGNEIIKHHATIEQATSNIINAIDKMRTFNPDNKIFISNIDVFDNIREYSKRYENRIVSTSWIKSIVGLNTKDVNIFDLVGIIEDLGRNQFYSNTLWYMSSTPISEKAIKLIADKIRKIIRAISTARKKCLILDMDNTLWGGVLGEDGPFGIKCSPTGEGAVFYDFQTSIKKLKDLGVILTIASKNNMEDVDELFRVNDNLYLSKDDFSIMKVNWNRKSENIIEIAEELNIGLDSMVFIDDNPAEREQVRIELPDVVVPEFPSNTYNLNSFIEEIYEEYFFTITATEEDKMKTKQYIENAQRNNVKSEFNSYEEYLDYLDIKLDIREVLHEDIERAAQLTQKTNQFNLTTRRYTENDIKQMKEDKNIKVLIGEAKDRFGDYGKIILAIYKTENKRCIIDTFLMSCRAMGRNIETNFLNKIEKDLKEIGVEVIEGVYIPTKKNKPAQDFYIKNNYELLEENEKEVKYIKRLD